MQPHITTLAGSIATEPMDPSTSCAKQSKTSCPQQQKPKSEASIWAENTLAQCILPSKNSATPNPSPDPLSRQTTALPKASSLPKCTKNFPNLLACATGGCWMKDQINQRQFNLIWAPGKFNLADYFTKHHPPWHHHNALSYCHICVVCDLSWLHVGERQQQDITVYMLVIEQAHDVTYSQQSIPLLSIASRITLKRYYTRLLIRSMERSTVQDSKGCHSELRHKTHCRKCSSVSSRHRISPVPFAGRWTHHRLKRSHVKYR